MSSSSSDEFQPPQYIQNTPIITTNKNNNIDSYLFDYAGGLKSSPGYFGESQKFKSNPFDSSDSLYLYTRHPISPLYSVKNKYSKERLRYTYPNSSFIRKVKELKSFIISETERLNNQDTNFGLGANLRQEIECLGNSPNCSIRRRMMKMGLI